MLKKENISIERILRGMAGSFVLLSIILSMYHNPNWIYFTLFVGFNLFQSSITNFCPVVSVLKKAGFKECK